MAAVIAVMTIVGLAFRDSSSQDSPPEPDRDRQGQGRGAGIPADPRLAQALDARYQSCVAGAGFDAGGVQVLVRETGLPWWVKTGRDVPAHIHRPCLVQIGGADPQGSSHGYPA